MNIYLSLIIATVRALIAGRAQDIHAAAERALTVPKRQREVLYAGMSNEDREEAERLYRVSVDATADYAVFVASRGEVEAD